MNNMSNKNIPYYSVPTLLSYPTAAQLVLFFCLES